jgi:hypothetical protein
LPRKLAALAGITQKRLRALVRVRFVKVAEYQARGAVHYHAVIRLDAPGEDYQPPLAMFTADLLRDAIRQAAAAVRLVLGPDDDHPAMPALALGFGDQTDPKPIRHHNTTGQQLTVQAVANYVAKYATKTLTASGLPDHRIRTAWAIDRLSCPEHYRQMIAAAWQLGHPDACGEPLRRWAHMLGFGGHFLTKSRRYSITFGQLRAARREHRRAQAHPDGERDPWDRPLDDSVVLVRATWTVTGTGYRTTAEADLAMAAAARAREHDPW